VTGAFVGFRTLFEVTARQDRRNIAPWIVLITALSASSILAYSWVFPDPASRLALSAAIGANPAFNVLFGQSRDLTTAEGFNSWRTLALGGFFAALMAILTVVRNSRADEDSGQAELIASGVVGRHARLAVAVALAGMASLILGVVSATVTVLLGGAFADSVALSATYAASGLVFAGVAAVTAQIGSYARTATAMAVSVLGVCYLARAYSDTSDPDGPAIWFTPLGWTAQVRPAAGNNWWPLLACLGLTVLLLVVANVLLALRDFGMGLVPPSPGPDRGGAVTSVWGLALRLHRGSMLAWTLVFVLLGFVFGYLSTTLGGVFARNATFAAVLGAKGGTAADLTFAFLLTLLTLLGIIAAVYGVQVGMRFYAEELDYRAEPLLAAALTRPKLFASHAVIALAGPAVAVLLGGAVIGLTSSAAGGSVGPGDLVAQALAEIPAVWVLIGLSLALIGAHPIARPAAWLGVVAAFVLTILGPMFRLWDWILGISPFWHVPNITTTNPDYLRLLWLSVIAAALIAAGFAGYRRRDVI